MKTFSGFQPFDSSNLLRQRAIGECAKELLTNASKSETDLSATTLAAYKIDRLADS